MQEAIIVLHLITVIALIVIVLIQKSEGGALGIGGGGGGGMGGLFSARGAANVLTRVTAILAVVFFSTSLGLAIMAQNETAPSSILDTPIAGEEQTPNVPGTGTGTGSGNGILDTLRRQSPQPSSEPQVPTSQ